MKLFQSIRIAFAVSCVVLCGAAAAWTADKKDAKPALAGSWAHKGGEMKIEFVDNKTMKLAPHGDKDVFTVVCTCTIDKNGLVKAKIADFEGKAEILEKVKNALPVGTEFSFQWQVKNDEATIDDVKCDKSDAIKSHLEGKYEAKK